MEFSVLEFTFIRLNIRKVSSKRFSNLLTTSKFAGPSIFKLSSFGSFSKNPSL
jgi:hypothetical protein